MIQKFIGGSKFDVVLPSFRLKNVMKFGVNKGYLNQNNEHDEKNCAFIFSIQFTRLNRM